MQLEVLVAQNRTLVGPDRHHLESASHEFVNFVREEVDVLDLEGNRVGEVGLPENLRILRVNEIDDLGVIIGQREAANMSAVVRELDVGY